MIEYRILKPEEYPLLEAIPAPDAVKFDPSNTWIVAAFDGGKIVGRLVALSLPHIEAIWVAPEHRGGVIGARLESSLIAILKDLGAKLAIAYAINGEIESYLQRLGYTRFATAWRKDI